MSSYHFDLFSQIRENKSSLYFALLCASLIIRELCIGRYLAAYWPEPDAMTFEILMRIEYFTLILGPPLLYTFFYSIFFTDYPLIKVKIVWYFSILYGIVITVSPYHFYSKFVLYYQIFVLITGITAIILLALSVFRKRIDSTTSLLGALIFYLSVIHDVLVAHEYINPPFLITFGIIGFIFSQSFIIIRVFTNFHQRTEQLNIQLTDLNINLKNKVSKRTEELQKANDEMLTINEHLQITKDALLGEMHLAKRIQTVLLPDSPEIPGFEICAYMEPAEDVGGDYYDVINAAGINWVVIGDVAGHGIASGLVMMMVQTAIHVVLDKQPDADPANLLCQINNTIYNNIKKISDDKYITITVLSCHKNGTFNFAGLHQDIMIYRKQKGEVKKIETDGCWIGLQENINNIMVDDKLFMNPGDVMLLYTDGIIEAWRKGTEKNNRDPERDMYGEDKLINILKQNGDSNIHEIKENILKSLDDYIIKDDITFLLL